MATVLRGGVPLNDLSRADVRQELEDFWSLRQRAEARGKKRVEFLAPVQPAAATVFLGQTATGSGAGMSPDEGYVWSLKLVSCNLSATSTLNIYKASSSGDTRRPLCPTLVTATVQAFTWSSDQARLKHGEGLYLVSTTTITGIYVAAWQVPAELEAEVYD